MSARIGAIIGLFFALVWLNVGLQAMAGPWRIAVGAAGVIATIVAGVRAWRRPLDTGRFDRKWYLIAVAGELAAMALVGALFDFHDAPSIMWAIIGIIVGLHFIGLWRAVDDRRFLWLAGGMTAINIIALALTPGAGMQMLTGFGSSAALVLAVAA